MTGLAFGIDVIDAIIARDFLAAEAFKIVHFCIAVKCARSSSLAENSLLSNSPNRRKLSWMKHVPPSISVTAFNCPHCGALAKQFWYDCFAKLKSEESPTPLILNDDTSIDWSVFNNDHDSIDNFKDYLKKKILGFPFFEGKQDTVYASFHLECVYLSKCFNCKDLSLWLNDKLAFPSNGVATEPNPDLPQDIASDYREASSILNLSPRGAAALVRLCIQKLCIHLGQEGKNINNDISELVKNGLDPRIQKALDSVRVIGNNAVHPGIMDLKDDRATAESLFKLLNLIAEKTISEPKHVDEVYDMLPPSARAAIAERDKK